MLESVLRTFLFYCSTGLDDEVKTAAMAAVLCISDT